MTDAISPPSRFVQARAHVALWEYGRGDCPLLLLHGFPDHPVGLRSLACGLADSGCRVLVPALPGYPPSGPAPGGEYSLTSVAQDLVTILDALGIDRALVVGHDWGASLAYILGARYPDRVARVVAIAAPHPAGFARRRESFTQLEHGAYALFLAFAPGAARIAAHPRWLTAAAQMAAPSLHREDWPVILSLIANEATLGEVCRYYRCDIESPPLLEHVRVPATVIHGDADAALEPALFRKLDRWFTAGVVRHLLPGVGHWPHLERPAQTLALIRAAAEDTPA